VGFGYDGAVPFACLPSVAAFWPEPAAWLVAAWLFVLGAVVGSFLNVVVHRLPQRRSIVAPGSHCPRCGRPVRWYDNVPIASWFVLRGRCRDCGEPISARYPLVEAATAGLFLLLGWVEWLGGGANLPRLPGRWPPANADAATWPATASAGVCGLHLLLMVTLLAAALIAWDRRRVPWRLFLPAAVVGLAAPIVWPWLRPLPAWPGFDGPATGLVEGLLGAAAGALLGGMAVRLTRDRAMLPASGMVGLVLGWQAAAVAAPAAWLLSLAAGPLRLKRVPPTAWLAGATLLGMLLWGRLTGS
jgi:leader peptidase (prepilin peptidase) / N-methyltransferase